MSWLVCHEAVSGKIIKGCVRAQAYAPFLILSFLNFLLVASEARGTFFFSRIHDRLRETWRVRKIFIHLQNCTAYIVYLYTPRVAHTKTAGRRVLWLVFRIIPRDIIWGFISWNHGGLTGWFPPSVKTADSSKANPPPPWKTTSHILEPSRPRIYFRRAVYTSPISLSTARSDPGRGDAAGFAVSFQ